MSPIIQVMLGFGIGLAAAILLAPAAYEYFYSNSSNNRNRKNERNYWTPPGYPCPICLEDMEARQMQYLNNCGHAFHDNCLKKHRETYSTCPVCRQSL